jgi:hypothetical protein
LWSARGKDARPHARFDRARSEADSFRLPRLDSIARRLIAIDFPAAAEIFYFSYPSTAAQPTENVL